MFLFFRQWLAHLLQRPTAGAGSIPDPSEDQGSDGALVEERSRRLAAESELQRLRLDLSQANQRLVEALADLQRQEREEAGALRNHLEAQLEELLAPLATPLTQLLTQQHLIEREGKGLGAKDLLATSRRLWQGLASAGVDALETVGAVVAFDPDRHQPLSQESRVGAGALVRVRIPGLLLNGHVLKTAGVEPIANQDPTG
jgi:hypothetical protein